MKKFTFKLAPLMKYRQYQERVAQQKTARAHQDVKESEQTIARLEKTLEDQLQALDTAAKEGVDASRFQQHYQYMVSVESDIDMAHDHKKQLKAILKKRLVELKQKSVEKRAMELYHDRLKNEYIKEMGLAEQKELDEIVTLKTARKRIS